jgi:hypothetical protein
MRGNAVRAILAVGLVAILLGSSVGCTPEAKCRLSGGKVTTAMCCESTGDFPDNCAVGACGCAPESSHEVRICDCGEGRCFNGDTCVVLQADAGMGDPAD